ncbi:METTL5 family protein [Methanothermococcus okinawensis]|uniref:METTL5 family protein n=1 Tax=Methanothermococcus okinawensis TaxID=155863 RepID=UPI00064EF783|nr:METTL5 family protein [Methanothermococcus okinawensis]
MKKRHLEIILDNLKPHPNPKSHLEQYTIGGNLASEILFFAKEDILNNFVIDLGCGTGKLAVGAKILGAKKVLGVDIDRETVKFAEKNVKEITYSDIFNKLNLNIDLDDFIDNTIFLQEDVKNIDKSLINKYKPDERSKNIIIQNPPFGSQKKYADRIFLNKALEIGDIVYTIHNTSTREFIINYIKEKERIITNIFQAKFRIPQIYSFHKKKYMMIPVDIYRIE